MTNPTANDAKTDVIDAKTIADDGDWLGYGAYADALWGRTVRALDKDKNGKPLGDDPLVIGIFGEWGAGKSHLLKLVYERAKQQSAIDIANRVLLAPTHVKGELPLTVTVPVMFQPWKYEHEPHLHVPLAIHVADALDDAWKTLPSDFEQVKVWANRVGKDAKDVSEKLEAAKVWINKLGKFWDNTKSFVKSDAAEVVAGTLDVMATAMLVPPVLSLGLSKVRDQLGDDEEEEGVSKAKKSWFSTKPEVFKKTKPEKRTKEFSHSSDGLAFYRINKLMQAMTRPKFDAARLKAAGFDIADGIEFDLRINFVVFVDDLDRCLPEKAVETLELIKTTFNTESFAFVLALDDEVIERGIGHRYKDYQLVGKKPEMPITGFEYLEKIIHVPFRLPTLTREQAGAFVRRYEREIEPDVALRWFEARAMLTEPIDPLADVPGIRTDRELGRIPPAPMIQQPTDLLDLALSGFDVFMPRKLIRLVELTHQVAAIARLRQKPFQLIPTRDFDIRVVLALLLIQLFQPELFRMMRRRGDSFPTLLAAFAFRPVLGASAAPLAPDLPNAQMADIDLWRWAVDAKDPEVDWSPETLLPLHSHAANCIARAYKGKPDERTSRTSAQQVRLPIVLQLIEHRAAQRHVFDVLKLVKRLADEMTRTGDAPHELDFGPYRSLLAQQDEVPSEAVIAASAAVESGDIVTASAIVGSGIPDGSLSSPVQAKPTFSVSSIEELAQLLVSPETEAQANMVSRLELRTGHVLDDRSAANLVAALKGKLTQGSADDQKTNKLRALNGLQYLAPYIAQNEGQALWVLVEDIVKPGQAVEPKVRALWGDVREALGCDDRFDPQRFNLLKERFALLTQEQEPLIGFVRVPAGRFTMGDQAAKDNPLSMRQIDHPFYLSRTLVTVGQFALFVADGGYAKGNDWWDSQGRAWQRGEFGRSSRLNSRPVEMRQQPLNWEQQLKFLNRPMTDVNWFEARAYARWLNGKLRSEIVELGLPKGYELMLPTEVQWERAVRACDPNSADNRIWVWGDSQNVVGQEANLGQLVGSPCVVGLFPASPIGLYDMAGNAWEWMDNSYALQEGSFVRVKKDQDIVKHEGLQPYPLAVRGASWIFSVGGAKCSFRGTTYPEGWYGAIGFRVVLSLPD